MLLQIPTPRARTSSRWPRAQPLPGGLMAPVVASASEETAANGEVDDLQVLLIKEAIHDQIVNYCISMDRLDQELGYNVFTEDCMIDFGPDIYQGDPKGFVDTCCLEWHPPLLATAHCMTNVKIVIDGPDAARSMMYGLILMVTNPDDEGNTTISFNHVRYHDQWVKQEDGQWRVSDRKVATDWNGTVLQFTVSLGPTYAERTTRTDAFCDLFPEYK